LDFDILLVMSLFFFIGSSKLFTIQNIIVCGSLLSPHCTSYNNGSVSKEYEMKIPPFPLTPHVDRLLELKT
jgi:hypothetical protein